MAIPSRLSDETKYNDDIMFNTTSPNLVEILVSMDGRVYITCDGKARFHAINPKSVVVIDDRNRYHSDRPKIKPIKGKK